MRRASHMSAPRICPAAGCGRPIERWQQVCKTCFRRLPNDKQAAIAQARLDHDFVGLETARNDAMVWLREHRPAASIARLTGERIDAPG